MPQITIHLGGRERLEPAISRATPLGALGTEALVWIGTTRIRGSATALGIPQTPTWDVCQRPVVCLVLVYLNVTGKRCGPSVSYPTSHL